MKNLGKVYILGDSYSTFEGWIPQGYATFYRSEPIESEVTEVTQTWWHLLLKRTDSSLFKNESFSGTTVCHTGYDGYDPVNSFIGRFDRAVKQGEFAEKQPDTVLVFGGTNDTWNGSPVGAPQWDGQTDDDNCRVLPAFGYLFRRLQTEFPRARVVAILNDLLSEPIADGVRALCERGGITCVALHDVTKMNGHPDAAGMRMICDQVLEAL